MAEIFSSMRRSFFFISGHFGEHYVLNALNSTAEIFSSEGEVFFLSPAISNIAAGNIGCFHKELFAIVLMYYAFV